MAEDSEIVKRLSRVGERFRAGSAELRPLSDKTLSAVRTAVQRQWDQEKAAKGIGVAKGTEKLAHGTANRAAGKEKVKSRSRVRDSKSNDHGHSF